MSSDGRITPEPPRGVPEKRLESRFPAQSQIEVSWVDDRDRVKTDMATVMNHSDRGLGLKILTRVAIGTLVWMRDVDGDLVKAVVRYSRNHEMGDWQTGVRLIDREMRSSGRDPVHGAAELRWSAATGRTTSAVVTVVDLSDGGIGVISSSRLEPGQFVELIGEQFGCFCSVRNSRDLGDGAFRLGLLFAGQPHDRLHGVTADWLD